MDGATGFYQMNGQPQTNRPQLPLQNQLQPPPTLQKSDCTQKPALTPVMRARALSDSSQPTPVKLSPAPMIVESARTSKDDSSIPSTSASASASSGSAVTSGSALTSYASSGLAPVTPIRSSFPRKQNNLTIQNAPQSRISLPLTSTGLSSSGLSSSTGTGLAPASPMHATATATIKPAPPSPKFDHPHPLAHSHIHSQLYSSPTNIIPRRSRGLDFSRAATSLHHTTLAQEHTLDSSPTIHSNRALHPSTRRRSGEYGGAEQSSTSLWSVMGGQDRPTLPSSLGGGIRTMLSDSDSSSDGDVMDEDMDEPYVTTPHVQRAAMPSVWPPTNSSSGWPSSSTPINSLMSYRDKTRPKKQPKRRTRATMGMSFAALSKSPPTALGKDNPLNMAMAQNRRDSISWQANQLQISGSDADDTMRSIGDGADRSVIRKVVAKRGNLLPKTKGFARIRAALAEETAPIDSDFRREAEVVRQVMESDRPEPRHTGITTSTPPTAQSSPNLAPFDTSEDITEDDMMMAEATNALATAWKHTPAPASATQGRLLWGNLTSKRIGSNTSAAGLTTPPMGPLRPRTMSNFNEDMAMDSPLGGASCAAIDTKPSDLVLPAALGSNTTNISGSAPSSAPKTSISATPSQHQHAPTVAEITRRINNKRRRDDDFDPMSFKRRAVSPSLSAHNSPIMQSPMQRDVTPWGPRPGSASASGSGGGSASGSVSGVESGSLLRGKPGRVGYQGMVDTNDGIMRMSIE
ncbi:hypothetical protein TD95_000019 [Thielaviopsis punctulata]|uniref:Uncharacterized protein n=1 Tax=Thielaviopsis punctulata TaxID=72032 RepID=A0A0F4Z8P4_9PEZI|nr:hypothetical protein TD95_000019 [Thielaviopsis punctulata]